MAQGTNSPSKAAGRSVTDQSGTNGDGSRGEQGPRGEQGLPGRIEHIEAAVDRGAK